MSNTLFVRYFNDETLGETPSDLVRKHSTPNLTDWKIVASGPDALLTQSLRVQTDENVSCIALFRAVNPIVLDSSESLLVFKATVDQEIFSGSQYFEGEHYFLKDTFIGAYVQPGEAPKEAVADVWDGGRTLYPSGGLDIIFDMNSWYIMRVRIYENGGYSECLIKLWKYDDPEPIDWDKGMILSYRDYEPGICIGTKGPGSVDFAYFSVGYGKDNLPRMPGDITQWPHDFLDVPNARIAEIGGVQITGIKDINGVE